MDGPFSAELPTSDFGLQSWEVVKKPFSYPDRCFVAEMETDQGAWASCGLREPGLPERPRGPAGEAGEGTPGGSTGGDAPWCGPASSVSAGHGEEEPSGDP